MDPRFLLIGEALRHRARADQWLVMSKIAREAAEALEEVICNGTEAEVVEALKMVSE